MDCVYLKTAKYIEDYKISIQFNTQESGIIDLEPIIRQHKSATPLLNKTEFANFYLDQWPTLAWQCGFDISPESLYLMVTKNQKETQQC